MNSQTMTAEQIDYKSKIDSVDMLLESNFYVDCAWSYSVGDIVQADGEIGYVINIVSYDTLRVAWPKA